MILKIMQKGGRGVYPLKKFQVIQRTAAPTALGRIYFDRETHSDQVQVLIAVVGVDVEAEDGVDFNRSGYQRRRERV